MLRDDLKWKNSFDNFCVEHALQWERKEQLTAVYGRAVFDIISSRIYHDFIKQSLWDFYKDMELDGATLSTHIHNLYHEDLFSLPQEWAWDLIPLERIIMDPTFAFKAIGDGKEIEKMALDTPKDMLQSSLWTKEKIVCMFKVPDNLKLLQEMILGRLHRDTKLYCAIEDKVPSSFHIDWEKQENTLYKVTDSPFIR